MYLRKDVENTFRVGKVYDLAGHLIVSGVVVSGKVSQGAICRINGKVSVVERIEVDGAPIDYLLQDEEGDVILYGKDLVKEDVKPGQVLYFENPKTD